MNAVEIVKRDLHIDDSDRTLSVHEISDECPFSHHRLFVVLGATTRFDLPLLSGGSLGYDATNGHSATRLTRENKEIEAVLSAEWEHLPDADSVVHATQILRFYDGGIQATHHVLKDLDALLTFGDSQRPTMEYELNAEELSRGDPTIGSQRFRTEAISSSSLARSVGRSSRHDCG